MTKKYKLYSPCLAISCSVFMSFNHCLSNYHNLFVWLSLCTSVCLSISPFRSLSFCFSLSLRPLVSLSRHWATKKKSYIALLAFFFVAAWLTKKKFLNIDTLPFCRRAIDKEILSWTVQKFSLTDHFPVIKNLFIKTLSWPPYLQMH